jgi:hypothetical protein
MIVLAAAACSKHRPADPESGGTAAASISNQASGSSAVAARGAGDGGSGSGTGFEAMTSDQVCDHLIGMMEELANVVRAASGDCDQMGAGLERWSQQHRAFFDFGKSVDADDARRREFEERCTPRTEQVMGHLMGAIAEAAPCHDNERVRKALESLG